MLKDYAAFGLPHLPIDECLPELAKALADSQFAVLVAPPGAGKTTRVPLALLDQSWLEGRKIIMLEPRRLAARSAAFHIAGLLNEQPGETVGYRIRMDTKTSASTRIEIVTDGVFTRMILDDPQLTDVGMVLFDEFHERSMDGDLGLALALECASVFRPDLRLLPMSATMDGGRVADILKAGTDSGTVSVIESKGRSYPVEIHFRARNPDQRIENAMAQAIKTELRETEGSLLCFMPGQGEIERTAQLLGTLPENTILNRLYGALEQGEQTQAIRPAPVGQRKVVLATSIAETSITIDGVTVVIDSGLARVPVYEPATGLTRLQTVRASKAAIAQRAGRAGRTAPGRALRLWHEGQTGSLPEYDRPEILEADLTSLILDLAQWGVTDPAQLQWMDAPPEIAWKEAREVLINLGAITANGAISKQGSLIRRLALPPLLAHMVLKAKEYDRVKTAATLAVLLSERGLGGNSPDLSQRMESFERDHSPRAGKARQLIKKILQQIPSQQAADKKRTEISIGAILSFAWPQRVAERVADNADGNTIYRLVNGRRAKLDSESNLSKCEYLTIADLKGTAASPRIFSAAEIDIEEIRQLHHADISKIRVVEFDPGLNRFKVRIEEKLGAMVLSSAIGSIRPEDDIPSALIAHFRKRDPDYIFGSKSVSAFVKRANFLHLLDGEEIPTFRRDALLSDLEAWLLPMIANSKSPADVTAKQILDGLVMRLGYFNKERMDRELPGEYMLPSGRKHALEYLDDEVILRARVQEFFGLKEHPAILNGKIPLTLEFLSPALRPIQKTKDIAGFWSGSWLDVRKEMRGRYPKHSWPQDPVNADATMRAKPRNR